MGDQQVFVFGSFTEDESRTLQCQSVVKSHVVSHPEKTGLKLSDPLEQTRLQFGSLDVSSLDTIEGFGVKSKHTPSSASTKNTRGANLSTEGTSAKKTTVSYDLQKKASGAQENGIPNGSSSHNNVVTGNTKGTIDRKLVCICENGDDNEVIRNLKVIDDVFETSRNVTYLFDTHDLVNLEVDNDKKVNGQAPVIRSLLPRGLINLGNICFLNATLQGLLSCSPFVQLLQDLANRNIPKIGYPTIHAFIEFISDFEMPGNSNTKKQERGVIETGKPFSPIMFDPVLKLFTPDIPISSSSRPRQEDAQEFLCFVMDRMHDELLKLESNSSSLNGGSLPLVSSSEDDGWETVGPKNKSAVTRTQSFIPSELSAIFGGQLRSVVKARGSKPSATVQPFLLLHLDILPESVHTIEDALHLFSASETVEGYQASAGKICIHKPDLSTKNH